MPVRSRSILSRRTLLRSSAAAGGLLLGEPRDRCARASAGRPCPMACRSATWSATGRSSGAGPTGPAGCGCAGPPPRAWPRSAARADRRRARGPRLRGQGRSRRPACGAARVLRGELPRPGRPQDHAASPCAAASSRRRPSRRNLRFVWSGDTAGQGWGINPDLGGMRIYETMRQVEPDFFIHSGDTIYADGPIYAEARTQDGKTWLGAGRQALAQPRPSRRRRRWPRRCASSG